MSLMPNLEEQEVLAESLRQANLRLPRREWLIEGLVSVGYVIATAALWAIQPPRSFSVIPAAICVLTLVVATRVRFDTPYGFTVATQLAFVPLLFALPLTLVPIAVAVAMMLARVPEVAAGTHPPSRLIKEVSNSWFAIGPVAVLVAAGVEPANAGPLLLIAALLAQFAIDFGVSTLRFRIERSATFASQLRETWVYAIDAALTPIALVVAEAIQDKPIAALAPLPLLGLLTVFARERHQRMEGLIELNEAYRGTALVLGDVVEADDDYTGQHSKGVVRLAVAVGAELGLEPERRRNLEFAALLHDIGKVAIPNEIINKPGKLDPDEWKLIATHTIEGQKMLDRVGGFMRQVGVIVRSHHERWDGGGYPDGLAGEAIPVEARIIACCDSWNAMRTDRSYRKALSHEVARAEMEANAGRQFDPVILVVFLRIIDRDGEPAEPERGERNLGPRPLEVPVLEPDRPGTGAHPAPAGATTSPVETGSRASRALTSK